MKLMKTIGLAVLLLAGTAWAGSKLILDKTFGLAETEKIEVLAYKGEEKTVKVKTGAGISTRELDSFPEAAQKEILAWVADEIFNSSSGLRVRIKDICVSTSFEQTCPKITGDNDRITYVVELENRGDVAVDGVRVEASIFYEQYKSGQEEKNKCRVNSSATFDILPEKKEMFKSRTVEIRDEIWKFESFSAGNTTYSTPTEYIEDKLNGMVLVLTRTSRNGEVVKREFKDGRPPKPKKQSEYRELSKAARKSR